MAHTTESLLKLSKDDLVRLALDYQHKQDQLLNKINQDLTELSKNYTKLESELQISKSVTSLQRQQIIISSKQTEALHYLDTTFWARTPPMFG